MGLRGLFTVTQVLVMASLRGSCPYYPAGGAQGPGRCCLLPGLVTRRGGLGGGGTASLGPHPSEAAPVLRRGRKDHWSRTGRWAASEMISDPRLGGVSRGGASASLTGVLVLRVGCGWLSVQRGLAPSPPAFWGTWPVGEGSQHSGGSSVPPRVHSPTRKVGPPGWCWAGTQLLTGVRQVVGAGEG